ncbi:MAG TPA: hypothetical protein DCR00_11950 [Gammaproteobacteria bacterium]|nr:hypothetical protein [Gammaproteobacteria bacterium]
MSGDFFALFFVFSGLLKEKRVPVSPKQFELDWFVMLAGKTACGASVIATFQAGYSGSAAG